jgi:hypothetical protein
MSSGSQNSQRHPTGSHDSGGEGSRHRTRHWYHRSAKNAANRTWAGFNWPYWLLIAVQVILFLLPWPAWSLP